MLWSRLLVVVVVVMMFPQTNIRPECLKASKVNWELLAGQVHNISSSSAAAAASFLYKKLEQY